MEFGIQELDLNILKWSIFILWTTIFTACPNSYFPLKKLCFFTIVFICCFVLLQIYTDWANHYLEKAKNKHTISDLQQDVSDGVLLAEVIEAVSKCSYNLLPLKVNCLSYKVHNSHNVQLFTTCLGCNAFIIRKMTLSHYHPKAT